MGYKLIAEFFHMLQIVSMLAVPVLIIWFVARIRQNETNRRAEIMLRAIDKGAQLDPNLFRIQGRTIKERLLGRLTGACVTFTLGLASLLLALIPDWPGELNMNDSPELLFLMIAGALLAVGLALFGVYFAGRRMLAAEIAEEEKQITGNK